MCSWSLADSASVGTRGQDALRGARWVRGCMQGMHLTSLPLPAACTGQELPPCTKQGEHEFCSQHVLQQGQSPGFSSFFESGTRTGSRCTPTTLQSQLFAAFPAMQFKVKHFVLQGDALSSIGLRCVAASRQKHLADQCSRHRQAILQML